MSGKTPGHAARETLLAAQRRRGDTGRATPWDELPQDYRDDWEDIAKAGTVTAWRLLDEARAERDEARAVARELLGFIDRQQIDLIGPKQLAAMARRAGLKPAVVAAGTEHLAAQLAEEGR